MPLCRCLGLAPSSAVGVVLAPQSRSDFTGCGIDDSTMQDLDACLNNIGRDTISEM